MIPHTHGPAKDEPALLTEQGLREHLLSRHVNRGHPATQNRYQALTIWHQNDHREAAAPRPGDNRYPEKNLAQHQAGIERLARQLFVSARGGLPSQGGIPGPPPDAGLIYIIREAVRAVWDDGGKATWAELRAEDEEARARRHSAGYPAD